MKKGILIICLIFLAIGLGNVLVNKFWPPKEKKTTTPPVTITDISGGAKLSDSLKNGKPVICVFNNKTDPIPHSGTIYINGLSIRTDYTVTGGKPGNSQGHLISDGEYFYIWTDQNTGFKLQISAFPGQNATTSAENLLSSYMKMDTNSEIKCLPWQVDTTMYELPSNIDFKDLTKSILDMKSSFQPTGNH
jgi:hypothetical protein